MSITYQDIENANKGLKTTPIKGKDYIEVNQRIKAFRINHPTGGILTDIVDLADEQVVMKATVTDEDGRVLGTGTAFEVKSSSYINKTSYIENCETSAIGRALGMAGYGIDASIASADEVASAIIRQGETTAISFKQMTEFNKLLEETETDVNKFLDYLEIDETQGMTVATFNKAIEMLNTKKKKLEEKKK